MSVRRVGIFGGTFDPIHLGHTTVASEAAKSIGADKLIFVPAKRSPLKGFLPRASDCDRLEMIALAIADEEKFEVSDFELRKPAPSYSLETVKAFQSELGQEVSIYWLIGADTVDDLIYWHGITELIDACHLVTMFRAGCEPPDFTKFEKIWGRQRVEKLQRNIVQTPLVAISSSEIRKRFAEGQKPDKMLNKAVLSYILKNNLYRQGA
jgi:nicotinate-nucleotide adenylyltransferase